MKDRSDSRVSIFLLASILGVMGSSLFAVDRRLPKVIAAPVTDKSPTTIPEEIRQKAIKAGLALQSIRLEGENWVACESGEHGSCVVLGQFSAATAGPHVSHQISQLADSDLLQFQQYGRQSQTVSVATLRRSPSSTALGKLVEGTGGTFPRLATFELHPGIEARVTVLNRPHSQIDTLPRYRLEAPGLVRTKDYALVKEYMDSHPAEAFMVVVTVPALCAPCRDYDQLLHESFLSTQAVPSPATAPLMKTFILEYFTFADAERELLGSGAVFPTTLVFEPRREPRQSIARFIGSSHNQSLEQLGAPVRNRLERGAPHTFTRGLLSRDLLQSLRRL